MDPHLLANLFKRSNYVEPIASEFCALDYPYEVLLEICENYDEEIYEEIHDNSFNKKHDCNDFPINSLDVNCANNMQNPKLGDASFAMSTTWFNDQDWGDSFYKLENLFKPHEEYEIDNSVCNNIESGFGRLSTLDPTYLENVQSYGIFDKSGFGEVMTLVNVNPLFWKSVNFACMWIVLRICYVIAILLKLLMILHLITMREENMVVEIFMLLNYLSLCWDCYCFFLRPCIC